MSLLGIHFASAPRHDGLARYLQQAATAGSPFAVIVALDQNIQPDVVTYSPHTQTVFRHQVRKKDDGLDDAPLGMDVPELAATNWYQQSETIFRLNPGFTFYACTNELNPKTHADHVWANRYWLKQMQLATAAGRRLVWGNWSAGNPEPDEWVYYADCVRYAVANDHALGLHEYGLEYGSLQASAAHGLALRYREAYRIFHAAGWGLPWLMITECAPGSYVNNSAVDLADVKWYDSELMRDRRTGLPIVGAALYQWGGAEADKFAAVMPQLTTYVASVPQTRPETISFSGILHRQYAAELRAYVTERGGQVTIE